MLSVVSEFLPKRFFAVCILPINGSGLVPCSKTVYFGNRQNLFDVLKTLNSTKCALVCCVLPNATQSDVKLRPRPYDVGFSWNGTYAVTLTGVHLHVRCGNTVSCAT